MFTQVISPGSDRGIGDHRSFFLLLGVPTGVPGLDSRAAPRWRGRFFDPPAPRNDMEMTAWMAQR